MAEPVIWLDLVKVVATLCAASVAAWVTWRIGSSQMDIASQQAHIASEQKRIAAAKLALELFEERYDLFHKVWGFLSTAGKPDDTDMLHGQFTNLIPKAQFLFGPEIANYMREAHTQRIRVDSLNRKLCVSTYSATPEQIKEHSDLQQWFYDEASNCFKRFAPYLDFSVWRAGKGDPLDRLLA